MKEQTISNLKKLKSFHNGSFGADIDRAIQALEQQPLHGYKIDMFTPTAQAWLSSFNTNSATECFTAVQEFKEKLNGQMD